MELRGSNEKMIDKRKKARQHCNLRATMRPFDEGTCHFVKQVTKGYQIVWDEGWAGAEMSVCTYFLDSSVTVGLMGGPPDKACYKFATTKRVM